MRGQLTSPDAGLDVMPPEREPRPPSTWQIVRQTPRWGWPAYHDLVRTVATLERAAVFFGLPDRSLRALARRTRRVSVLSGELIVHEGEPGDTLFFIEHGRCRMVMEDPPHAMTVAVLAEGDVFGEEACVQEQAHHASVYSQGHCTLLALDRTSLYAVLGRESPVIKELKRLAEQRRAAHGFGALHAVQSTRLEQGSVVAVHGSRGGSGATSIALNLTGALARRYPGQALLLDLDLPFAHSALLAGLIPTTCLARLKATPPPAFDELLLSAVMYHAGGPMILAGALLAEEADEVTSELVSRAIAVLRKTFRHIVVDTSATFTDPVLTTFELAQAVVLVVGPELSAVKSAADSIDVVLRLGVPEGALRLVLNNRVPKPVLERGAVERLLQRAVDVEVGFDGARPALAGMRGEIVSLTQPRSELTRAAEELADLLERTRRGEETAEGVRRQ